MADQDSTLDVKQGEPEGATQPDGKAQDGVAEPNAEKPTPDPADGGEKPVPSPKTFSEVELNQRILEALESAKAGHKGTVKKMREELATATRRIQEAEERAEEASLAAQLKVLGESGAESNVTEYVKSVYERDKAARKQLREIEQRRAELAQREAEMNVAAVGYKATQLVKEHGLDDKAVDVLVKAAQAAEADDRDAIMAMENAALKLKLTGVKAQAVPVEKPDKVVSATPKGINLDKLTPEERLGLALEGKIK